MSATVAPTLYTRVTRSATRAAEAAALASASVPKTLSSRDENETVSQHQADTLATDMPQASIDQTPNTTNVSSLLSSSSAPDRSTSAAAATAADTSFTSPPPPTTKPRQKRKAKSSALDQPESVGMVIAGETKPSSKRAKKRKDSGIALEDDTTKALEQQQQQQQVAPALLGVPPELFTIILSYLYPSEIAKLAMASKQMYKLIESQPIWRTIMTIGKLPEPKLKFPTEMIVVLAYSDLVCEQCMSLSEMKRGMQYSDRPLPVSLTWNNPSPSSTSTSSSTSPPHRPIHLCRPCRRDYYRDHESELGLKKNTKKKLHELIYECYDNMMTKADAIHTYQVTERQLAYLDHERFQYYEEDVQEVSYRHHGGPVGVTASRRGYVQPRHLKPRPGITPRVRKMKPLPVPEPDMLELSIHDLLKAEFRVPGEETNSSGSSNGSNIINGSSGDPSGSFAAVVRIGGDRRVEPVAGLPVEIWHKILAGLCMRDLVVMVQVSKPFQRVVEGLPMWKTIWTLNELPALTSRARTYMAMVCRYGESICELCDMYSYPKRDALANRPLPVLMEDEYSETRRLWLCLECRRDFLEDEVWESDSDSSDDEYQRYDRFVMNGRITESEAMELYNLPRSQLTRMQMRGWDFEGRPFYLDDDAQDLAVMYHGGMVGVRCVSKGGYQKPRRQRPKRPAVA